MLSRYKDWHDVSAWPVSNRQASVVQRDIKKPADPLTKDDPRWPGHDPRYADMTPEELPLTECLKATVARVVPYWENTIKPQVAAGTRVIIAAHGKSLRALVKHLDAMSEEAIVQLNIPAGRPLVKEFDDEMKPIRHYYLGNADEIAAAMAAVAAQGKAKK